MSTTYVNSTVDSPNSGASANFDSESVTLTTPGSAAAGKSQNSAPGTLSRRY